MLWDIVYNVFGVVLVIGVLWLILNPPKWMRRL